MNKPILAENLGNANEVTMTSLEMVSVINLHRQEMATIEKPYVELRHADFMAKVPKVLGLETSEKFRSSYLAGNGERRPSYDLPKREACLMAMSYSYELQASVFDRMTALEDALIQKPTLPDYPTSLRLLADQIETNKLLEKDLDEAIATKAQISRTREATAMGRLSAKSKEVDRLKMQLGESKEFATVAAVNNKLKTNFGSAEGRALSKFSKQNNISIRKAVAQDQRFSEVNSYHQKAWMAVFNIDLNSVFGA